jgi:NAD(P)H-nitrite reductase large subunit
VYAAGEITGIGGVDLALAEGALAGHTAAGGRPSDLPGEVRKRRVYAGFARRIEAAHGIRPGWPEMVTEETIVCRCEEVSFGSLCRTAESTGSTSLRSLKLSTRAGLGICQGRACGRSLEQLIARRLPGNTLGDAVSTDRRPLAVPLRLGELAAAASSFDPTPATDPSKGPQS